MNTPPSELLLTFHTQLRGKFTFRLEGVEKAVLFGESEELYLHANKNSKPTKIQT